MHPQALYASNESLSLRQNRQRQGSKLYSSGVNGSVYPIVTFSFSSTSSTTASAPAGDSGAGAFWNSSCIFFRPWRWRLLRSCWSNEFFEPNDLRQTSQYSFVGFFTSLSFFTKRDTSPACNTESLSFLKQFLGKRRQRGDLSLHVVAVPL